ncbi:hypothetical protein FGG79_02715 [Bacillus sp. BHET2]|nr:hypothetical protein FGG79_02715 [Bacillus sp. BHET2]
MSTEETTRDTKVLVSIGNRDQLQNVDFEFTSGIPIEFNSVGVSVFNEVILNTCANIKGIFKKPGEYIFTVALLDQVSNELLDEEIAVFKVSPSGHQHKHY